jgi:hypothetical protein
MTTEPSGVLQALGVGTSVISLSPLAPEDDGDEDGGQAFAGVDPATGLREPVVFAGPPDGPATGVHQAGRLHRRVG